MSQRIAQIESLLKRAVAKVLQRGLADPRTAGALISVTRIDVSPDLRHATVFVSILPAEHESRAIHGLQDATMHIQHGVKKEVALRVVPHLLFRLDRALKKENDTLAAITEAMRRTAQTRPHDPAEPADAQATIHTDTPADAPAPSAEPEA